MSDKKPTIIEAENVVVAENTPAQVELDAAEERADRAEEMAADIADAALRTAQGQAIEELKEEVAECQTEQLTQENEAEADRRRIGALEATQAEILSSLSGLAGTLSDIRDRLTPPMPVPSPTPEPVPMTAEPAPGADAPEAPVAPRRRLFRLI